MNRVTITGPAGEVWWKTRYSIAARLGSWSLTADTGGGTLTAAIVSVDDFKASQQPLMFVVPRPTGADWKWPITSLQMTATTLIAQVGPSEE